MIGVILWSDDAARKAVVWCEDQGDLAFLDSKSLAEHTDAFFSVGDVVRFDLYVETNMRRAHNARFLEDQITVPCAVKLKPKGVNTQTAKIIPFRVSSKLRDSEEKRNAQGA